MRSSLFFIPLLLLSILSCKKDTTTELEGQWLFPIAKGALGLNSVNSLKDLQYHIQIQAQNINEPTNVVVSSPGIRLAHVGPFPVLLTDWLKRLDIDTLSFSGSLNNFFPIPIGAGTQVVMRTTRDTSSSANIAGAATIGSDVPPGGRFSFDIQVRNKTLYDSVYFFLENFNSPPYTSVMFTTTPSTLDITLKVINTSYLEIYTNRTFNSTDTTEFSAGSDDQIGIHTNGSLSDTATSGVINVFADNGLPANAGIQLYFLDNTRVRVLDSLFLSPGFNVEGGRTDGAGNPVYVAATATKIPISRGKLDRIKAAAYVTSQFRFNTFGYSGAFVALNRNPTLAVQLTGDLKLNIHF